jgi:hypothetical protein
MSLDEHPLVTSSLDKHAIPVTSKKPWLPPQLMLIPMCTISNNAGSGGDGDAALAHS